MKKPIFIKIGFFINHKQLIITMKKHLPLILVLLACCFSALAQQENVGINTDPDSSAAAPVFNRTVTLRDTWAKLHRG